MIRGGASSIAMILLLVACGSLSAYAETTATAKVTYLTSSSLYIDAGAEEGLRVGSRVEVVRDGSVVAVLEVAFVSAHKASCSFFGSALGLEVGELVRFHPEPNEVPASGARQVATPTESASNLTVEPRSPGGLRSVGIQGRIGIKYLAVKDHLNDAGNYSEPAADLMVIGEQIAGSPIGLQLDVRTRRTFRSLEGAGDQSRTRVYRALVSWNDPQGHTRVTAGRQYSPALATISIFDGLAAEYGKERWSAGMLVGTQPDPIDFGVSGDIREAGAYYQYRGGLASPRRWEVTTGLIGSYQGSEINREFLYLQGRYSGPRFNLFLAEEVDYNRGWKKEAGESTVSPTSTFLSTYYRISPSWSLRGGYDNRRNARLYRNRITPETEFDDAYRQGVWVGTSYNLRGRFRFGLDGRNSSGGAAGKANSVTLTLGGNRVGGINLGLNSRTTVYENERQEGWLQSLSVGFPLGSRVNLALTGGIRDERDVEDPDIGNSFQWYGIDLDIGIAKSWYLLLSAERSQSELDETDLAYLSLSYRF